MSQYPEHEKLKALNGENIAIGNFLEWLDEQRWYISTYDHDGDKDYTLPISFPKSKLLAMYFNIDENRLENEKRHMLEGCRIARGEDP